MKQFLRFRLVCHDLPVAVGRHTKIDRADGACPRCAGCVGDERMSADTCSHLSCNMRTCSRLTLVQCAWFLGRETLWVVSILSWTA